MYEMNLSFVFHFCLLCAFGNAYLGVSNSSGFGSSETDNCKRGVSVKQNETVCYELRHNTCFDTVLPYSYSTSALVNPTLTQQRLQDDLSRWEGLRSSPKCWAVLQPLLCAVYMPKCQGGIIELPSPELCRVTRSPCRLVEEVMVEWPEFLKCDDPNRYPPHCKNTDIRKLHFNKTGECRDPMIGVNDSSSYYEGFEGCGLKCKDALFSEDEHKSLKKLILCGSLLLLVATLLVIITYWMDWKSAKELPSGIIVYVVICYTVANFGWVLRFMPNGGDHSIVCANDGTIRRNEEGPDQNLFCIMEFALVYFGSLSALGWMAVFAYVWNLTCNTVGRIRERLDKHAAKFHCSVWLSSSLLTIMTFSFGLVDGNSMSGICFVGNTYPSYRIGFVLIPPLVFCSFMFFYLTKGLYRLYIVRKASKLIPKSGRAHLRTVFFRFLFFTSAAAILIIAFVSTEIYQLVMRPVWDQSLRDSIICRMKLGDVALVNCEISQRPSFTAIGLSNLLFFFGGFLICTLACTRTSIDIWKRKLPLCLSCFTAGDKSTTYHHRTQRHHLIAQAYEKKRKSKNAQAENLSLSLRTLHADPIGLNGILDPALLDLVSNSQLNQSNLEDVDSEWFAALPHLLNRRNAIAIEHSSVNGDSEDASRPHSALTQSPGSNIDVEKTQKKSKLRRLKEKFRKNGRRASITSFESSDVRPSTSDLDVPKSKSGLTKAKDRFGWRKGVSWRSRVGSVTSLSESNASAAVNVLPAIQALIKARKQAQDQDKAKHESNRKERPRKTAMVKEASVQTSFENISFLQPSFSSRYLMEKSIQTSILELNLQEQGTQTRKSATKNKHKKRQEGVESQVEGTNTVVDPVIELLTPY